MNGRRKMLEVPMVKHKKIRSSLDFMTWLNPIRTPHIFKGGFFLNIQSMALIAILINKYTYTLISSLYRGRFKKTDVHYFLHS